MRVALWMTAVISMALLLAGCAFTDHWAKPGATYENFYADSSECAQRARVDLPARFGGGFGNGASGFRDRGAETDVDKHSYRDCMFSRGYQRNAPNGWHGYHD